jgi:hypothetical protein
VYDVHKCGAIFNYKMMYGVEFPLFFFVWDLKRARVGKFRIPN